MLMQNSIVQVFLFFAFYLMSFNALSQRVCDSYLIANEPNSRKFIAINHVDHYDSRLNGKYEKNSRTVKFNGWFEIEKVTELIFSNGWRPMRKPIRIKETKFNYNLTTAKLTHIVKKDIIYYEKSSYSVIDSIQIGYNSDDISTYSIKTYTIDTSQENVQKEMIEMRKYDGFKYDSSNLVLKYDFFIDSYQVRNPKDSTVYLAEPIHIDSILMEKDSDYVQIFNSNSMIKCRLNSFIRQDFIYNKFNQLVSVVTTSNSATINEGTYKEVLAVPNATTYKVYRYNNKNYLLNKIIYYDSKVRRYKVRKYNYSFRN